MSRENVEIVRRANAAFNSGDATVFVEFWASDAELRDLANAPDQASVVKGRAAIEEVGKLGAQLSMSSAPTSRNTSTPVTS